MLEWDEKRWPNFSIEEFRCKHTGKCEMQPEFLDWLQMLRWELAFPFHINSGYRDKTHPAEASKPAPGAHAYGVAADIGVQGMLAHSLVKAAMAHGVLGLGVKQKGDGRFIHLDLWKSPKRPMIWSY